MSNRPQATVLAVDGSKTSTQVSIPDVFSAPIRVDIIRAVHRTAHNRLRQPFSVSPYAGHDVSAVSWGTGRAVSRIPRVNGSGTHRSGQGAFANMCRGGRMFNPTRVWRNWSGRLPTTSRRYATVSAIAASGVAPLVLGRGHKIENIAEVPFVVSNEIESFTKTKQAVQFLKAVGAYADVERVIASKSVRAGKGKGRGRRYKNAKGPLVVYKTNNGLSRAFKGIAGVDVTSVDRLNILQLAPGGQPGRFIIWTQDAFNALATKFGSYDKKNSSELVNYGVPFVLPEPVIKNTDITAIIESDSVQAVVTAPKLDLVSVPTHKLNPLKSWRSMRKLNPYGIAQNRRGGLVKSAKLSEKAQNGSFLKSVVTFE